MFGAIGRFVFGRDVFVSYAYVDSAYAEALGRALRERRLTVFIGGSEAPPGPDLSPRVVRAAKWCGTLAVVATPNALASRAVQQEVELVARRGRTIIPIDVRGTLGEERWPGTAPVREDADTPSPHVLERIENAVTFARQERRLRLFIFAVIAGALLIITGAALFSRSAEGRRQQAIAERLAAERARADAEAKTAAAREQLAIAQRVTRNAERLRDEADAHRQREAAIAAALSHANESSLLLQREPSELAYAALLAAAASKRLHALGVDSLAAYTALRSSLRLLPQVELRARLPFTVYPKTPDGRFATEVTKDGHILVHDSATGKVRELPRPPRDGRVLDIEISGDGGTVIAQHAHAAHSILRVWRVPDGALLSSREQIEPIKLTLSDNGNFYATTDRAGETTVYRTDGSEERSAKTGEGQLRFSPSGRLLAISSKNPQVWAWQTNDGPRAAPTGPANVIFNPADENIVATGSATALEIWNWHGWEADARPLFRDTMLSIDMSSVSFSGDGSAIGYVVEPAGEARCALWKHDARPVFRLIDDSYALASGSPRRVVMGLSEASAAVVYSDGTITLFEDLEPIGRWPNVFTVDTVAFLDERVIRSTVSYEAVVWRANPIRGTLVSRGPEPPDGVEHRTARSPSGKLMATVQRSTDVAVAGTILPHEHKVNAVAFAGEDQVVTANRDWITVWAWRERRVVRRMPANGWTYALAVDRDLRFVAAVSDETVQVWPLDRDVRQPIDLDQHQALAAAFSKDAEYLAIAQVDSRIQIVRNWQTDPVQVGSLTAWEDRYLRSMVKTLTAPPRYPRGRGMLTELSFSPDDRYLDALVDGNRHRFLWRTSDLVAAACERLRTLREKRGAELLRETCGR